MVMENFCAKNSVILNCMARCKKPRCGMKMWHLLVDYAIFAIIYATKCGIYYISVNY